MTSVAQASTTQHRGTIVSDAAVIEIPRTAKYRAERFPDIPAHVFADEASRALDQDAPTGVVTLDLGHELGTPYRATTPLILCRYLVIRAGERIEHHLAASGEIVYVIRGSGSSETPGTTIEWRAGDVFCLPGGRNNIHRAVEDTVLFHCTDEPALCFLRTGAPSNPALDPALFSAAAIDTALASIYQNRETHRGPGNAVNLYTAAAKTDHAMLPLLNVAVNSLEPGGRQRPHRHNPIAVTLAVQCDRVYSIIGEEKIDWRPFTAVVTPPGQPHTHCNDGPRDMRAFVVQDGGLHYYCRTGGFELLDYGALT